ncbi:ChaN family lipoprotein [Ectothiorhodospiraceae bacterium 2226]|nr:ChaN family lipoprotein [Ectothiorhodospiraceae bacterium 2226]
MGAALALLAAWPGVVAADAGCPPRGAWMDPASGEAVAHDALLARLAREDVVLLGERHAQAEHQRWQLHTLAGLHARRPNLVLGLEMFPRRVQEVLDRWVAGELDEAEFLRESEWDTVWGYDPAAYLPLFHYARMHRIPMVALNVDRAVMGRIRERGFDQVPRAERDGVGEPAPASPAYREALERAFRRHARPEHGGAAEEMLARGVERFIQAQLTWDRAMAEGIHTALQRDERPLVVGLMGSGHVEHGHGVPAQLADLEVAKVRVLLAWPEDARCEGVVAGLADAVFGIQRRETPPPQRLGILLSQDEAGVRVEGVEPQGVGEAAGLREADVIVRAGGREVRAPRDIIAIVREQPPGSWLPLEVLREEAHEQLIAKFPVP